jgi:hypothetical protein
VASSNKLLKIYLADSLALLIVNKHLAARCLANNRRGPLGLLLDDLKLALEDDRGVLEEIMEAQGARKDPIKGALAWSAVMLGRLKLNGSLIAYSDLSRLYELEGLCALTGPRVWLWRSMGSLESLESLSLGKDLQRLIDRAERQGMELDRQRQKAAVVALRAQRG